MLPYSIGNIMTWAWTGYNMLIIYSALRAIPTDVIEAARVDGCGEWRLAFTIKAPMVRPALVMTSVFSIIGTAQLYNEPVVLQHVAANLPSDYTPIMAAQQAVANNDYNYAGAQSIILAALVGALSFGFLRLAARRGTVL
jgi:multiple sugar transport system permease protein